MSIPMIIRVGTLGSIKEIVQNLSVVWKELDQKMVEVGCFVVRQERIDRTKQNGYLEVDKRIQGGIQKKEAKSYLNAVSRDMRGQMITREYQ